MFHIAKILQEFSLVFSWMLESDKNHFLFPLVKRQSHVQYQSNIESSHELYHPHQLYKILPFLLHFLHILTISQTVTINNLIIISTHNLMNTTLKIMMFFCIFHHKNMLHSPHLAFIITNYIAF